MSYKKTIKKKGYQQVDLFDSNSKSLDIRINGLYPSNVLSTLYNNEFCLDGVVCCSMEGFLQSLKHTDRKKQKAICSMKGKEARKHNIKLWQTDQVVWWKGQAINRQGEDYQKLLRRAFNAMFEQCEKFRAALMSTRGIILIYSCGVDDSYKETITEAEFCQILTELRDNYDKRDKQEKKGECLLVDTGSSTYEITVHQGKGENEVEDEKIVIGTEKFPDWNSVLNYLERESKK